MSICYYISSHGFGHAVRATEIIRHLPDEAPLIVKSGAPAWFLHDELKGRNFQLFEESCDCGAIQFDGLRIDALATLQTTRALAAKNKELLKAEADLLKAHDVRLVVSDIPPFACRIAQEAGISSLVIANFTWVEICQPMVAAYPEFADVLEELRADYALADLALIVSPHTAIDVFPHSEPAPMVARRGHCIREELAAELGFAPDRKLFLIYFGELGIDGADWRQLEQFDDAIFLSLQPLAEQCANLIHLEQGRWRHPNLTASCDAIIAKPGYGILGECLANGTPLVYTSREGFAEYFALEAVLRQWAGGIFIPPADFKAFRWSPYLEQLGRRDLPPPFPLNGAQYCAKRIMQLYDHARPNHG